MASQGPLKATASRQTQGSCKLVKKSVRFSAAVYAGLESDTDYNSSPTTSDCSSASKTVESSRTIKKEAGATHQGKKREKKEEGRGREQAEGDGAGSAEGDAKKWKEFPSKAKKKRKTWRTSKSCNNIKGTMIENASGFVFPKELVASAKLDRIGRTCLEPVLEKSVEESINTTHLNSNQSYLSLSIQSKPKSMENSHGNESQCLLNSLSFGPSSQWKADDFFTKEFVEAKKSYFERLRERNQELETRIEEMQEIIRKLAAENDRLVRSERLSDEKSRYLVLKNEELVRLGEEAARKVAKLEKEKQAKIKESEIELKKIEKRIQTQINSKENALCKKCGSIRCISAKQDPIFLRETLHHEDVSGESGSQTARGKEFTSYPMSARSTTTPTDQFEGIGHLNGVHGGYSASSKKKRTMNIEDSKESGWVVYIQELFGWTNPEGIKEKLKEVASFQKYCENFYLSLDDMMRTCSPESRKELNGNGLGPKTRGQHLRSAWRFIKQMLKEHFQLKKALSSNSNDNLPTGSSSEGASESQESGKTMFKSYVFEKHEYFP